MRFSVLYRLVVPKCIGNYSLIIIVLSRFQSPFRGANGLANLSVERIHLDQWYSGSNTQAQGRMLPLTQLSSQIVGL